MDCIVRKMFMWTRILFSYSFKRALAFVSHNSYSAIFFTTTMVHLSSETSKQKHNKIYKKKKMTTIQTSTKTHDKAMQMTIIFIYCTHYSDSLHNKYIFFLGRSILNNNQWKYKSIKKIRSTSSLRSNKAHFYNQPSQQ